MDIGELLQEININLASRNLNNYTALFYKTVMTLSDSNNVEAINNVVTILTKNRVATEETRLVIYNSLKYFKFDEIDAVNELHSLLINRIDIHRNETSHLLKGLHSLYKQRRFRSEIHRIMIMMRKLFCSPSQEIQVMAEKIIVVVIDWFSSEDVKAEITEFFGVGNWDSHHYFVLAKLVDKFNGRFDDHFYELAVRRVFKGLESNHSSHSASTFFISFVKQLDFDTFKAKVFPTFREHLIGERNSNRTLSGGVVKYILPTCSDKYRRYFYEMCINLPKLNFYYSVHLVSLNYLKYSIPKSKYAIEIVTSCLKTGDDLYLQIAFGIMCRYRKLNERIVPLEIAIVKQFISKIEIYDRSYIINFQYFLSHMSVICYDCLEFLTWVYITCMEKLDQDNEENAKIFGNIFYVTLEILTGSSKQLKLDYNLPANKNYNEFENPIYLNMIKTNKFYFVSNCTVKKFLTVFIDRDYYTKIILDVIVCYFLKQIEEPTILEIVGNLDLYLFTSRHYACNRALYCIDVVLNYYRSNETKCLELFEKMTSVLKLQFKHIIGGKMYETIEKYPLFVVIQCILNIIRSIYLTRDLMMALLNVVQDIIEHSLKSNESKSNKSIEHTIIISIDLMYSLVSKMEFPESLCRILLEILERVITDSNLKRPVSHATLKLEQLLHDSCQHEELYLSFYYKQESRFKENSKRSTKIRRKAGTRLILHALARSHQEFVNDMVKFLLRSGHDVPDSVAAALHTLESLISDTSFKSKMSVYVPDLLELSLKNLDSIDFAVKNASIQVFQAITMRLLGQKSETGTRPLSAIEVFQIYPDVAIIMLRNLFTCDPSYDVSKIAVLSFLSESNYSKRMYCETSTFDFSRLKLLYNYPNVARFAVSAFVAVCPSHQIFDTVTNDIEFLTRRKVTTNEQFYRICTVEQLYKRFLLDDSTHKKVNILCEANLSSVAASSLFNSDSSQIRVLFLLNNVPPPQFCRCLNICLHLNYSQQFLHDCLNIVYEKCSNVSKYRCIVSNVIVVLINFLTALNKSGAPVITTFYKTIMVLFDLQTNFVESLCELRKPIVKYHLLVQHVWLIVYGFKSELNDKETNNVSLIMANLVQIAERGRADECYIASTMLRNLVVLLKVDDGINFLYLLIVLTLQLEEDCEINYFISYVSGRKYRSKNYLEYLLDPQKPIFCKDPRDIKLLSRRLFEFISNYDVTHEVDKNFYTKSRAVTAKLSLCNYVLSLLCKLQKCSCLVRN